MKQVVLDASVVVKWAIPSAQEPFTAEALRLFQQYRDGAIDVVVPEFFWAEIGNILWKGVRQKRWTQGHAENAASDMRARDFTTINSSDLLLDGLRIAFAYDRSLYDCLYLALAKQAKADFITADERLANAVAAYLPVKWLGAL